MDDFFTDCATTTGAVIAPCGQYRYKLWREWDENAPVATFVMLNPSTADAVDDDPTIRRCLGFAREWGMGGLVVVNLFALRSTDPEALLTHAVPVGPENNQYIRDAIPCCGVAIAAWGRLHKRLRWRADAVLQLARDNHWSFQCLGKNSDGSPKHPLYLPKAAKLEEWP